MSGFDTFRRVWSILIFGVYSAVVLIYMVTHVRKRKHIGVVQHGLATLTLESANWLFLAFCYMMREWAVTANRPDDLLWAQDLTWLTRLATAMFSGVGWAVSYSRAYVVMVKFTKVGAARYALFEVRTARGQLGVIFMAIIGCSLFYMVLELAGEYFCLGAQICRRRNALPNTFYLIQQPLTFAYAALMSPVVEKCKKAGASAETTGILIELDVLSKFLGATLTLQMVLFILVDARVIPYNAGFEFFSYNHYMFVLFGLLYCLNIAPARRQGYGPFDRTDQVAPDDEMEEDDKMEQALPGNQPSGAGEMPANDAGHTSPQAVVSDASPRHPAIQSDVDESNPSPRRSSMSLHSRNSSLSIDSGSLSYGTGRDLWGPGGKLHEDTRLILHLMRRVEGLSLIKRETGGTQTAKHEALFELARSMLTEEAVRCTARLVRLLQLGGHNREELEEARSIYRSIVQDHLAPSAPMPIDVPPWQQQVLLRLLTVSARRRVIFQDDFMSTTAELQPLIVILAPRVIPVLRAFIQKEAPVPKGQSRPPNVPSSNGTA